MNHEKKVSTDIASIIGCDFCLVARQQYFTVLIVWNWGLVWKPGMHEDSITHTFVIYDNPNAKRAAAIAAPLDVQMVNLATSGETSLKNANAAIVRADLGIPGNVVKLKAMFSTAPASCPKIFLIDGGRNLHRSKVQAAALGGVQIQRNPQEARAVYQALRQLKVPLRKRRDPLNTVVVAKGAGGESINAASKFLRESFGSVISGVPPFDFSEAEAVGNQVLEGVKSAGLDNWLDTVREYHEATFQHCLLVAGATAAYALYADFSEEERISIMIAALLHDIGKSAIPLAILEKPGKLTEEEFSVIKTHPMVAHDYLRNDKDLSAEILDAITHHHEFLDGTGYPDQLKGTEIRKMTRIMTVCDIYGALSERRSYHEPKTSGQCIQILSGMALDGKVDFDVVCTLALAVGVKPPLKHSLQD